ncbi:MAG: hypothetical protein N2319_09150 [Candidatus Kapabacteria bacterium]|nr:hypothetical protein [Candidatus Kapabacteria bacterium]
MSFKFIQKINLVIFISIFLFIVLLPGLTKQNIFAQNQNAGIGTNSPHPSAILELSNDLVSSPKGFLIPRMNQTNRNLISSPATSLLIYQTDNTPGFYYFDGSNWIRLISGSINLATEVTGILPIANGGTNTNATPTAGAIAYGTGTEYAFSSVGTTGFLLTSGGSGAPTWTDPATLGGGNSWALGGNSGTNPTNDFLGTIDAQDLVIRTNNTQRIRITSTGSIYVPGLTPNQYVKTDGSSNLITGNLAVTDLALNSGQIIVGNSSNIASAVSMSGDGLISNTGVLTVTGLRGRAVSATAPTDGYVLKWNNTANQWEPAVDAGGTGGWMLSGNSIATGDFLGTTNNQTLNIRTNNTERIKVTAAGTVGISPNIGSITPDANSSLHVISQGDNYYAITAQGANGQTQRPVIDIYAIQNGDANLRFNYNNNNYMMIGLDYTDNNNFKVSRTNSFNNNSSGYTASSLMMEIHTESGSEGIIDFNHQSRARAYRNATQTINSGSWTKIQFNTENFDEKSEFDNSTNYRFTAKETGYYQINARTEFDFSTLGAPGNTNSYVSIAIYHNGSAYAYGSKLGLNNSDGTFSAIRNNNAPVVSDIIYLQAGEYVEIFVYQNTGGNYNIISGSANTYFSIHKIS